MMVLSVSSDGVFLNGDLGVLMFLVFVFQLPSFSGDNRGKDGDECGVRGGWRVF